MPRRPILTAAAALLALALPQAARAWPDRPVTIVAPFGGGSSQDVLARVLAPRLMAAWGQPVVVQNVTGAAGTIGVDRVAKAPSDGHTLVLSGDAAIVVRVSMSPRPLYDPVRDLAPISLLGRTPNILVVAPASGIATLAELVAQAKARPGTLTFGHSGAGTSQHVGGEMLRQMAGIDVTAVSYNDQASLLQDVLTGRVTMSFNSVVVSLPRLRDGSWRGLAVSKPGRIAAAPDILPVAEQGYPGFDAQAWLGLLAPAATPPALVQRIHDDVVAALRSPEAEARLTDLGIELVGSTPEEFRALIGREIPRMAGVLRAAGIRPE